MQRQAVLERKGTVPFDPDQLLGEMVQVSCGTKDAKRFPGQTVAQLRVGLASELGIPQGAMVLVNGSPIPRAEENHLLTGPSQRIEFIGQPGPKG